METTWIVVAHRAGARIFAHKGRTSGLQLVEEIAHPEGRLRNRDIDADEPGRTHDRFGAHRHAVTPEHSAVERETERFAKTVAEHLEHGRTDHRFQKLALVAEPRLLGVLRDKLDAPTAALVTGTVERDLMHIPEHELPAHLAPVLSP